MCQHYQMNFKCLKSLHVVPFREKLHVVNFQSYLMGERWRVASGQAFPSKSLFVIKTARKIQPIISEYSAWTSGAITKSIFGCLASQILPVSLHLCFSKTFLDTILWLTCFQRSSPIHLVCLSPHNICNSTITAELKIKNTKNPNKIKQQQQ